jgi:DNA repair photolyase
MVDVMNQIAENTNDIMTSFATKSSEIDSFILGCKNPSKHRVRLSLSPENHRQVLEQNTSKTLDRLTAVNKLVDAGFEVHINLSPVVVTDDFKDEYSQLFQLIDSKLSDKAKAQMAYEIIFLTHSEKLFDPMSCSVPKAHDMMVNGPLALVPKWNKPNVLSYSRSDKSTLKALMQSMISQYTPYSRVRYMF